MKRIIASGSVALALVLGSAGVAFAHEIELDATAEVHASATSSQMMEDRHGADENVSENADENVSENADNDADGDINDDRDGDGDRGNATSSMTRDKHGDELEGKENKLHGLPFFFRWLFGLPATTTVGDIRAEIEASSTASSTSPAKGLGFFARLFSFFDFFGFGSRSE